MGSVHFQENLTDTSTSKDISGCSRGNVKGREQTREGEPYYSSLPQYLPNG